MLHPEMLDQDETEILHLKKRMELDGDIYEREVAYMSDHQVFQKLSRNGASEGWGYWQLWSELKDVYQVAKIKKERGWTVDWNPRWNPDYVDFAREVRF